MEPKFFSLRPPLPVSRSRRAPARPRPLLCVRGHPRAPSPAASGVRAWTDDRVCRARRAQLGGGRPVGVVLSLHVSLFPPQSLLRSPEVVQFLQRQQQLLNQQVLEQRQPQCPGASG